MEKESLMLNPLSFPEEKFTEDGKRYYYTRGDGTPITDESWSLKDLAYPLNVPFGGKRQGNLSDWSFTNWLVNAAPGQLAPIGAAAKGIKTMRNQHRTSPHGFYRDESINIGSKKSSDIVNDVFDKRIPRDTSSSHIYKDSEISVSKGGLLDPNRINPNWMGSGPVHNYNPTHIVNQSRLRALRNQTLFKNLSQSEQNNVLQLINPIDEYTIRSEDTNRTSRGNPYNPAKPSSGYLGQRKLVNSNGDELGIRWNTKEGGWKLYNRSVNLRIVDQRNVWNKPSSPNKAGEARVILESKAEANKMAKRILDRLKDSDSAEDRDLHSRIVGGQNPFQVEHINNQDSSVWIKESDGSFRHAYKKNSEGHFIKPGDPENYRLVGIYDFKYLKDGIEAYMKSNNLSDKYHLEMDSSNNLYVKHGNKDQDVLSRSGNRVVIHRSLDSDKGVEAFEAIINGAEQKDLPTSIAHDYRRTFADWMQDPEGGRTEDTRLADKGYSGPEKRMLKLQDEIEKEQRKLLMTTSERSKTRIRTRLNDLYTEGLEYMNQDAIDPSIRGGFNFIQRMFRNR